MQYHLPAASLIMEAMSVIERMRRNGRLFFLARARLWAFGRGLVLHRADIKRPVGAAISGQRQAASNEKAEAGRFATFLAHQK